MFIVWCDRFIMFIVWCDRFMMFRAAMASRCFCVVQRMDGWWRTARESTLIHSLDISNTHQSLVGVKPAR